LSLSQKAQKSLRARWWNWNLSEARHITFFTIYDLDVPEHDHVIKNNYYHLRSLSPAVPVYMPDTVVFIGQCSDDDSIAMDAYLDFLSVIRHYFGGKNMLYVAHPRDSRTRISRIIDRLQCELWPSSGPIEYDLLVQGIKPVAIAGFVSSALITLARLMPPDVSIICFQVAPEYWRHWKEEAIGAYDYIRKKEHARMSIVFLSEKAKQRSMNPSQGSETRM
jgi:hypothetical protein